ncbi:MAG: DUF1360 domain-containing protein [Acidimicrobiales bacterium]
MDRLTSGATDRLGREISSYAGTEDRPLGGYLALLATYGSLVGALSGVVRWRGRELPEGFSGRDLALMTVATHKVARIVTRDPVTSPFRAYFTQFEGATGEGEIAESVRGRGLRHAIGELLTCPFCVAQWIATLFAFGLVLSPRVTRFAASLFAMLTGSDLLQIAYARAQAVLD